MAETITIIDDRTGKKVTVQVKDGVFASSALRELDPNLRMYDPAFLSTAACSSSITYLDGEAGVLRYRGYPIEQLAEKSNFLEVAYLLLNGELPTTQQAEKWQFDVTHHTMIHENMRKRFVDGKVMLNKSATVVKTDVGASNGVIHVIDTVIMPPAKKADAKSPDHPGSGSKN